MSDAGTEPWDGVHTVNGYYDGPERGVADYRGKPHIYQREWDGGRDDFTCRFLLSEIEPELLSLVSENWEIWLRWDAAYRRGDVDLSSHPALPEDRARHEELVRLIGNRLTVDREHCVIKWARFSGELVQWLDTPAEESLGP